MAANRKPKLLTDYIGIAARQSTVQLNPVFAGRNFQVQANMCFVMMPFSEDLKPVYDDHIKKVVENLKLVCVRGDDIFSTGPIVDDIWASINRSRIIIADLTKKNPNVFYEVGIAHTVGKEVILLTQNIDDVPFDLRHRRCLTYEFNPRGMETLERNLKSTIVTILSQDVHA